MNEEFKFGTIEQAIEDIKNGKMVLVTDDEDRENEGDLIMAAEKVTPEAINFMAKFARGLICMPAAPEVMDKLQFGAMVAQNTDRYIDCTALIVLDDNGRNLIVIEDDTSLLNGNKATFTNVILQHKFYQEQKSPANRALLIRFFRI